MRVTIEIEPEEAARFVKAFMTDTFQSVVSNTVEWPSLWNEAAGKWLDAIRDSNGNETK